MALASGRCACTRRTHCRTTVFTAELRTGCALHLCALAPSPLHAAAHFWRRAWWTRSSWQRRILDARQRRLRASLHLVLPPGLFVSKTTTWYGSSRCLIFGSFSATPCWPHRSHSRLFPMNLNAPPCLRTRFVQGRVSTWATRLARALHTVLQDGISTPPSCRAILRRRFPCTTIRRT